MEKKIILAVDDEEVNLFVLTQALKYLGYEIATKDCLSSTVEFISELESIDYIKIVLLDGQILGNYGWEIAEFLRKKGSTALIFSVSGSDFDQIVPRDKRHYFNGFINKPFPLSDVQKLLENWLR